MAAADNSNNHSEAFMKQLHEEQKEGKFCDLLIEVGGEEFPCHRNVLAISCSYFSRLMNSDFEDSQASKITLPDIKANVFAVILEYFYCGVASINNDNAYEVLRTSNFLGSSQLENICKKHVVSNRNVENLIAIYHFSFHPLNDVNFRNAVIDHVHMRFDEMILLDDFYEITFEMLDVVLKKKKAKTALSASCLTNKSCDRCYFNKETSYIFNKSNHAINQEHNKIVMPVIIKWIRKDIGIRMAYFDKLCDALNLLDGVAAWRNTVNACISSTEGINEISILSSVPDKCHMTVLVRNADNMESIQWHQREGWIQGMKYQVNFENLKSVTIKNEIFYLTFESSTQNEFRTSETTLQPPPIVVHDFQLTASNSGNVYLYNSGQCLSRIYGVLSYIDFSKEISANSVYTYNTDYNKWFAIPQIPCYVYNAYFVSANNCIYVIGGSTKYWETDEGSSQNIIQSYDPRGYKWSYQKTQKQFSLIGAACAVQNKIYIYEKTQQSGANTNSLSVYDTVAGKWQTQICEQAQASFSALVPYQNQLWAFPFSSNHVGSVYDIKSRGWSNMRSFSQFSKSGLVMDVTLVL